MPHGRPLAAIVNLVLLTALSPLAEAGRHDSPVPADYQELVPEDAQFVFFAKDPARTLKTLQEAYVISARAKELRGMTLNKLLNDTFDLGADIPLEEPILAWSAVPTQLFARSRQHIATRIPGLDHSKIKPSANCSVAFKGDIVIFTDSSRNPWKQPEKTGNPLVSALPDTELSIAFGSKGSSDKGIASFGMLPMIALEMLSGGTRMGFLDLESVRETFQTYATGAKKFAPTAASSFEGLVARLKTLNAELNGPLDKADRLIAGADLGPDSASVDIYLHTTERIEVDGSFDKNLLQDLARQGSIYFAAGANVTRWMSQYELVLLEGFLLNTAKQIPSFDSLKKNWKKMTDQVHGGVVISFSKDGRYQWANIGTKNPSDFMAAGDQVMTGIGALGVGIETKENDAKNWTMTLDQEKLGKIVDNDASTNLGSAWLRTLDGPFVIRHDIDGNIVRARMYPKDKPEYSGSGIAADAMSLLTPSKDAQFICAMAIDGRLLIRKPDPRRHASPKHKNDEAGKEHSTESEPDGPFPIQATLSCPEPEMLHLQAEVPARAVRAYEKMLQPFLSQ